MHIGPSDYVPWLSDRKWAYIRLEGRSFGDVPLNVELKLEVHDSPNSAGIVIDAVRCCKLALDTRVAGALEGPSSYLMKSPPHQVSDNVARQQTDDFILGHPSRILQRPPGRPVGTPPQHSTPLNGTPGGRDMRTHDATQSRDRSAMRLCFIVEERYRADGMPMAVVQQLRAWGHDVDVLEPQSSATCLSRARRRTPTTRWC